MGLNRNDVYHLLGKAFGKRSKFVLLIRLMGQALMFTDTRFLLVKLRNDPALTVNS